MGQPLPSAAATQTAALQRRSHRRDPAWGIIPVAVPERFGYLSEEEARQLARRRAGVTRARQVRRRRRVAVAGLVSVALLIWALLGVWPSGGSQSDRLSAPRPARLQAAAAPHPSAPPAPSRGRAGQPRVAAGPALDRAGRHAGRSP